MDNAKNRTLIQTKLNELGFSDAQVKFIKAEAPAPALGAAELTPSSPVLDTPQTAKSAAPQTTKSKAAPVPFNQDDFKNDPLIRKALEVFKGQIVEVRA